jgi:elongator complex protein 2
LTPALFSPGTEDYLSNKSMWPERNKWYGHAYEIFSLATSRSGFIASSAKAKDAKYADVFLWKIDQLNPIAKLEGHKYTVVQMEFSHDDQYLLTVGRDK